MNFRSRIEAAGTLLFLMGLAGCNQPANAATRTSVPVKVTRADKRPDSAATRYSGSLEPSVRVSVAFRVGGYVEKLGEIDSPRGRRAIDKGDFVKKGTLLAQVRTADYSERVATANAEVAEARAHAALASAELERSRKLYEGKAISKSEFESAVARAASADASVSGSVARAGEAGISLGDTVLKAPIDGVVLSRGVEVGSLAAPGQPAFSIANTTSMKAVFGAPESLVERLTVGSPVRVLLGSEGAAANSETFLDASVTRIAPSADAEARVFSVEAELPNPGGALRSGAVVSVRVPGAAGARDELVVPLSAVIRSPRDPRGFSVFVLDGTADRARARLSDVELGEVVGNSVTVTRGLTFQARVVTVGATLLRDGSDAVVIR
jgi:multidrug efflux system membrane fusion protein